jgi:hypothetical protein
VPVTSLSQSARGNKRYFSFFENIFGGGFLAFF